MKSSEPLERWKREADERREAEERKRQAREAREQRQASNNWESWWAMINQRIEQWLVAKRNPLTQASGEVLGRFRAELRKEFATR